MMIGSVTLFLLFVSITQLKMFSDNMFKFKYEIEQINKRIERFDNNDVLIKTKKDLTTLSNKVNYEFQKEIIGELLNKIDFKLKF